MGSLLSTGQINNKGKIKRKIVLTKNFGVSDVDAKLVALYLHFLFLNSNKVIERLVFKRVAV